MSTDEVDRAVRVAVARLSPEDLAERLAWCEATGRVAIEPRYTDGSIGVDIDWGGRWLTVVHRDAFLPPSHRTDGALYRSAFQKYVRDGGDALGGARETSGGGSTMDTAIRAASDVEPGGPPDRPPALPVADDDADPARAARETGLP